MSINVSVLGCGVWGRNHARVFNELRNVNLISVVDLNQGTATEISKRYNTSYASDPVEAIADPEIDAVTICTPTVTHMELALQAIEAASKTGVKALGSIHVASTTVTSRIYGRRVEIYWYQYVMFRI